MTVLISEEYVVLFLIISLGLILGNIKLKNFSLDVSGVILVALLLGHFGFHVPPAFQTVGLLFFIYTIGMQAGPGFFDGFRRHGRQLVGVCLLLIVAAVGVTTACSLWLGINPKLGVGIFNGALTSTPGLAAAIDITGSPLTSIGYGLAYPVGAILAILTIHLLPQLFRTDMKHHDKTYLDGLAEEYPVVSNRNLRVENNNIDGKTIKELRVRNMTGAVISRVRHEGNVFTPDADTRLHVGDVVKVVGTSEAIDRACLMIGPLADDELPLADPYDVNWVLVTNKKVIGRTLQSLNLTAWYGAVITRIRRSGIVLSPGPGTTLRFGDKVLLACSREQMPTVMKRLGNDEKKLSETDFLPISLGILIGILLGQVAIPVFGLFEFSLGLTGGVLVTALLLSRIGKTGPFIWSISGPGNQLLRKLGLLMFLAAVGTNAGAQLVETLGAHGWKLLVVAVLVACLPMLVAALIGHKVLRMNFATLLGVIAGSMTSTPGLAAADARTSTDAAAVAYATVYPMALVLMIVGSQVLAALPAAWFR